MERLRKLQYQAVRRVIGGYVGARQETLEKIAKVEAVPVKLRDIRVRVSARILGKGAQDNRIEELEKHRGNGRSWKNHSLARIGQTIVQHQLRRDTNSHC